jgi:sodium-dependent phosphate cotransporter
MNTTVRRLLIFLGVVALLYIFLVSIGMIGGAFKLVGKGIAKDIFDYASNPLCGLFIGILTTSLVQSSSTTTSVVVGLVAGGMPVPTAIPIIMGANIGTSVTNTFVSLGHIGRKSEFKRAFAASTIHDFFNLIAVLILFPLQYFTNFLGILSAWVAGLITGGVDAKFSSPIKVVVKPAVNFLMDLIGGPIESKGIQALITLAVAAVLLFIALGYLTKLLRGVVMQEASGFFERTFFSSPLPAFLLGMGLTAAVQSSSITTSVVIPLAGAGLLTLRQIYPYTLGANVGTTITALLASLAAPDHFTAVVTVALSHFFFNLSGIAVVTPLKLLRELPIHLAEKLAAQAVERRWVPLLYIATVFFAIPLSLIYLTR